MKPFELADGPCCEAMQRMESVPGHAATLVGWVCPEHGVTIRRRPALPAERGPNSIETMQPVRCSQCGHEGHAWIDPNPAMVEWLNRFADATLDGLYRIHALVLAGEPVPMSVVIAAMDDARSAIEPNDNIEPRSGRRAS